MELLTGSGEVLVYYIKQWRHHFAMKWKNMGSKSRTSEKNLTATMLKVHLCGLLYLYGALSLPCGSFTPIQGIIRGTGFAVVCVGSAGKCILLNLLK